MDKNRIGRQINIKKGKTFAVTLTKISIGRNMNLLCMKGKR